MQWIQFAFFSLEFHLTPNGLLYNLRDDDGNFLLCRFPVLTERYSIQTVIVVLSKKTAFISVPFDKRADTSVGRISLAQPAFISPLNVGWVRRADFEPYTRRTANETFSSMPVIVIVYLLSHVSPPIAISSAPMSSHHNRIFTQQNSNWSMDNFYLFSICSTYFQPLVCLSSA